MLNQPMSSPMMKTMLGGAATAGTATPTRTAARSAHTVAGFFTRCGLRAFIETPSLGRKVAERYSPAGVPAPAGTCARSSALVRAAARVALAELREELLGTPVGQHLME